MAHVVVAKPCLGSQAALYASVQARHGCDLQGQIYVVVQYKPVTQDPMWGSGVLGSSKGKEDNMPDGAVPHVYFPMREGCRVTMYNDAHQVCHCSLQKPPLFTVPFKPSLANQLP